MNLRLYLFNQTLFEEQNIGKRSESQGNEAEENKPLITEHKFASMKTKQNDINLTELNERKQEEIFNFIINGKKVKV